jgi:hypothetical protein
LHAGLPGRGLDELGQYMHMHALCQQQMRMQQRYNRHTSLFERAEVR